MVPAHHSALCGGYPAVAVIFRSRMKGFVAKCLNVVPHGQSPVSPVMRLHPEKEKENQMGMYLAIARER